MAGMPLAVENCPKNGYITSNGMNFTIRCDTDRPNLDDLVNLQADNIQGRLNHCSTHTADLCGGAEFNFQTKTCWLKTTNITANQLQSIGYGRLGVANKPLLQPLFSTCNNDGDMQSPKNGLGFLVHCNQTIHGADLCSDESPDCRFHADSFDECLELCSKNQPLCTGVSFNWDLGDGLQIATRRPPIRTASTNSAHPCHLLIRLPPSSRMAPTPVLRPTEY